MSEGKHHGVGVLAAGCRGNGHVSPKLTSGKLEMDIVSLRCGNTASLSTDVIVSQICREKGKELLC